MSGATDLAALARSALTLSVAASPGPWKLGRDFPHSPWLDPGTIFGHAGTYPEALTHVCQMDYGWRSAEDAAFIVFAREALPVLAQAFEDAYRGYERAQADHAGGARD